MKNVFKTSLKVLSLCTMYSSLAHAVEQRVPEDFYVDESLMTIDSGDESSDWGSDVEEIEPHIKDYLTRKYLKEMTSPKRPFSDANSCYLLALHYRSKKIEGYKEIGTQALVYYHAAMLRYHEEAWPRQLSRHIRDVYNISEKNLKAKDLYNAISEFSESTQVKSSKFAICSPGFCDSY